jgi:hypothetical protein
MMLKARNALLSLGAAIATTKIAHVISGLELDDLLRPVGLVRRRGYWPEKLAFLGAGVVLGGVAALLLAPSSGEQTRRRLAEKASELGEAAAKKAREMGSEIRQEVSALTPHFGNGDPAMRREST